MLFWLPTARREAGAARAAGQHRRTAARGRRLGRADPRRPGRHRHPRLPADGAGPAGAVWLPAGQPGPRLRLAQTRPARHRAPTATGQHADDTARARHGGLPWHPRPHPAPPAWHAAARQPSSRAGTAMTSTRRPPGPAAARRVPLAAGTHSRMQRVTAALTARIMPRRRPSALRRSAAPRSSRTSSSAATGQRPGRRSGSGRAAGRAAAVPPGPAAGRRRPGRPVHRRLGLLVLAAAPAAWLARLRPMAAAQLLPGPRPGRGHRPASSPSATAGRQAAAATVTARAIRDLTPGSVTITVTVRQVITSRQRHQPGDGQLRGHPRPARRRLGRLGHRARQRGQHLKEAPLMRSPGR